MRTLKYIKSLCVICVVFFGLNANAVDKSVTQDASISTLSNTNITQWPMTLMADDPLALKINKWQKQQQSNRAIDKRKKVKLSKNRNKENINVIREVVIKPQIIKLEVSENEAKVTNKTKSFVFNDATSRINAPTLDAESKNIRKRNIESLRRSMARK